MLRIYGRRALLVVAFVALCAAVVLLGAAPAGAHTELDELDPPAGSSVPAGTTELRFRFTDRIELPGAEVRLVGANGVAGPALSVSLEPDGRTLVAELPDTASGPVTVRWSVSAADGHAVAGSYALGLGGTAASVAASSAPRSPGARDTEVAEDLLTGARLASYLGMASLVGGWVFLAVAWPAGAAVRRTRLVLWSALVVGLGGTILGVGAQAALRRRDLDALGAWDAWQDVAQSTFGRAWLARAALLLAAGAVVAGLRHGGEAAARSAAWRVGAAAVGVGMLRTPGYAGHATEGPNAAFGSIADLAHLLGVATWIGGLLLLAVVVLPRGRAGELAVVVPRFSRLAMGAVTVTVVAGLLLSWQLVGGVHDLVATPFGRTLLLKVGVVAAALGAAFASKRWVDGRLRLAVTLRGDAVTIRPFVLSVTAEVLLAVGAIGVASVLAGTTPPT